MNRICYLLVLCLIFASQGCKTSKKKRIDPSQQKPQVTAPFELTGKIDYGQLNLSEQEAISISFHPVVSGNVALDESVSMGQASERGAYQIVVPEQYYLQPGFLKAMVPLDSGERLELLLGVQELTPFEDHDFTVLTHLAAKKALSANSLGSPTQTAIAISDSRGQVASRFGIIGDISSIPLIEMDSNESIQSAGLASLKYSLLSNAIVRALREQWPELGISQSLQLWSEEYAYIGIAERSSDDVITLQDIFEQLLSQVSELQDSEQRVKVLERLHIELSTELGLFSVSDEDTFSQGTIPTGSGLPYLEKAKLMVQSIRDVVSSLDVLTIVGLGDLTKLLSGETQILSKLDSLGIEVDLSEMLDSEEFSNIASTISEILSASLEKLACEKDSACIEPPQSEIQIGYDYQFQNTGRSGLWELHTFSVNQPLNACPEQAEACIVDVDMQLRIDARNMSFEANGDTVYFDEVTLSVQGVFHRSELKFELSSDAPQFHFGKGRIGLGNVYEDPYYVFEQFSTVNLPFVLSENINGTQQTMDATVQGSVDELVFSTNELVSPVYYGDRSSANTKSITTINNLRGFKANIRGKVDTPENDTFLVSMNLVQPGKGFDGALEYTTETVVDCEVYDQPDTCVETELATEITGESIEQTDDGLSKFIEMDVSVGYKAILKALVDPAIVQFSVSRDSLEAATINGLKVRYPGQSLRMNGTFTSKGSIKTIGATDINGIVMDVNSDNGDRTGTLKAPDGTQLADISPRTDLIHIQFEDGYFVTF